ncbi:MAG: hypothetical protein JWO36_458 [Myxococcales bacterium]|nr:hypothetical protein [Myxococcales bacterium]
MRRLAFVVVLAACGTDSATPDGNSDTATRILPFGPFSLQPGEEQTRACVQITLDNSDYVYVNQVELTTGPGFHHSNWFFVPTYSFGNDPDGVFNCDDRNFNEPVAAIQGGVLFAQSTQSPHEIQAFPPGVSIKIPPHSKIIGQLHLLNPTDGVLTLTPKIALTPIPAATVTTVLAGVSFENHALGLPPQKQSRFTVDCDLSTQWQTLFSAGYVTAEHPDFKLYYALAHYHTLGTGMTVEAVRADGTAATIYTTAQHVGDALGGRIDPAFDMTGYTRIRFSCDYLNATSATVVWGTGNQEMCVFLAFSDSTYNWGGGVVNDQPPGTPTDVNGVMSYSIPPAGCSVYANDARR